MLRLKRRTRRSRRTRAGGHRPRRAALLLQGADVLEEHADELALIESRENGKPVQDAGQNDASFLIAIFRFFGSIELTYHPVWNGLGPHLLPQQSGVVDHIVAGALS